MRIFFFYVSILLSSIGSLVAQTKTPESYKVVSGALEIVPIDVTVPDSPTPFKARGRWNLAYELRIASFADKGDLEITRVEVLGQDRKALVTISGDSLKAAIDPDGAVGTTLKPRTYTTIFMWISASSLDEFPLALQHRVTLRSLDEPEELSTETRESPISRQAIIVIDPPLRGDGWVAANGPSNSSFHRRAILPVDGTAFIGQRYAIDWAQQYQDGLWFRDSEKLNNNYRGYGQMVYAVADGTITETKDGIPENVPGDSRAVEITLETAAGNHVIEQIGAHAYATYAHLQPGSLRVKLGDHVRRGQVLGLLGNSGNANAPHLHFQVCDANSVFVCNGVPYAISSFGVELRGQPGTRDQRANQIPIEGEVVSFPPFADKK
jgi:murein DD-endopeptidase MepM/ murein hydrolase activator NlpD